MNYLKWIKIAIIITLIGYGLYEFINGNKADGLGWIGLGHLFIWNDTDKIQESAYKIIGILIIIGSILLRELTLTTQATQGIIS